jgi:hypothetical protein
MQFHKSAAVLALIASLAGATSAFARPDIDAKAKEVARSILIVEYTMRNENASRQESGQGLLIHKDGIVLVSGGLLPESFPKDWVKDLKVRLPLKDFTSMPAKLLGRTQDRLFAFLKLEKPIDAPVFEPGEIVPAKMGQEVFSVAILGKSSGYPTYVGMSQVRTVMDLTHTIASTSTFGLTRGMSPVFDTETGKLTGITLPSLGEGLVLRDGGGSRRVELTDEDQSSVYLPGNEIAGLFKNIPTEPFDLRRPWIGVDEISGLQEDVKTLKHIEQPAAVMIGSVIPGEAADRAGLQAQDIVLTIDGKPFSKSPVPELMVMHFSHNLEKRKPGDEVTLGILRDGKPIDLKIKMGTAPRQGGEMPHVFASRVGIVTRDLVFADAYARHLPQDTKGVMIALVKNGSPASLGSTPLHAGLLITKVDEQPVENEEQFTEIMKKLDENKDAREAVFVVLTPKGETSVCRIDLTK